LLRLLLQQPQLLLQELVSSFQEVCAEAGKQLGVGELNVADLVQEPGVLQDAVDISKESVIEWMEMQQQLLAQDPDFVFRVKPSAALAGPRAERPL
jgi:hypothetical protein